MKKVFAVLLAILLLSSLPTALAEGGVALLLQSASREEAITIPATTLDLGLTMPQAVSLTTKREGDVTTVTLDGPVDEISVNWCAQGEDLEALDQEIPEVQEEDGSKAVSDSEIPVVEDVPEVAEELPAVERRVQRRREISPDADDLARE